VIEDLDLIDMELERLGRATSYPPTPDLAAGFWRALEARRAASPPGPWMIWPAAAAVLVAVAVLLGTVAPARDAAADLFGRINVFQTSEPLEGLPEDVPGTVVTLEEAEAALGRPVEQPAFPAGLSPEKVLLQDFGSIKAVVLYYRPPGMPRFALFQTNAFLGKGIARDSGVTPESLDWPGTARAFWFDGPHRAEYRDHAGNVIQGSVRRTGAGTLVWERNGFAYRIEGPLDRDLAVRIARSLNSGN
jgi:hypothetical protein